MGAQQSQPPPSGLLKIGGGVSSGFGVAGTIKFDANNGTISREWTSGGLSGQSQNVDTLIPNDTLDLGMYIQTLGKWGPAGTQQNPGVYPATGRMMAFDAIGTQVGADALANKDKEQLPMVTAWVIKSPPTRAVVYTDSQGQSKFLYRNDPGNIVKLAAGGSTVAAMGQTSVSDGTTVRVTQAQAPAQAPPKVLRSQEMKCVREAVNTVLAPSDQKKQEMDDFMKECMRQRRTAQTQAPAPAPVAVATSGYIMEGGSGGVIVYPMWVTIIVAASIVVALLMTKKI